MKKLLLLSSFLLPALCFAQNPLFDWVVVSQNCTGGDNGKALTTDVSGNSYATGRFTGTIDLDPGTGVATCTAGPNGSFWVAKYDAGGNYVWGLGIATSNSSETYGIALDASGNVIVCGHLQGSADFDPGPGNSTLSTSWSEGFVAKYDPNGNYIWAFHLNGTASSVCTAIKTDAAGDIYTTGYFTDSTDFDPGAGTLYLNSGAAQEHGFIAKYSSSGNLLFAFPIGGATGLIQCMSLAVSGSGTLAICGNIMATADFDPGPGVQSYTANPGNIDIFVAQYDAAGNFQWANVFGSAGNFSSGNDYGRGVCFDLSGNVIVTGAFMNTVDFDPTTGTHSATATADRALFVAKYNTTGLCQWALGINGTTVVDGTAICSDPAGNIYVTGSFENTADFDPGPPVKNLIASGTNLCDLFVASYTAAGAYRFAFSIGGASQVDYGFAIEMRGTALYVTGQYAMTADFDPAATTASYTYYGSKYDLFLARYDSQDLSGIAETSGSATFSMYPNPASENLFITIKETSSRSQVFIYNSLGDVVIRKEAVMGTAVVSVAGLSSGIYHCVVVGSDGTSSTQKFVIER